MLTFVKNNVIGGNLKGTPFFKSFFLLMKLAIKNQQ